MAEVIVIGAGVVGMASAFALARQGHAVKVVDAGSAPAVCGASFGNGAQLSYTYTDALASPSLVANLHKCVLGLDPAFRLIPTLSPAFWAWTLAFLANASQSKFEANTLDVLKLAMESRLEIAEIANKLQFNHRRSGKLNLYATKDAVEKAEILRRLKNQFGAEQVMLSREEAIEREPALSAYGHKFAGALWSPFDEAGDSRAFCLGLQRVLSENYGVDFKFGTKVRALKQRGGKLIAVQTGYGEIECNRAVIAAGLSSREIARTVGIKLQIWGMQGYSLTVPATDLAPDASITDTSRKVVFCRLGDRLRIAGLADIGGNPGRFKQSRFETLRQTAQAIFPAAGDYSGELNAWTALRPMTPDSRPIVRSTEIEGLFLNCGHGSLGWTLAMGTAVRLATMLH